MKYRNKKENLDEKADVFDTLRSSLFTALTSSVLALGIYAVSRLSWWTGLALFSVFAMMVLIRFIFTGITLIIMMVVAILTFSYTRRYGLNPGKIEKLQNDTQRVAWLTILMGLTEIYLLLVMSLLGGFLIFG
ncbi:MAG: hypothetical protein WKF92_15800 [Pyrinomonadaceae bacterium]